VSCDRGQRQAAKSAGAAGIAQNGNKAAGAAGRNGQVGGSASGKKQPRRRKVRRAVKRYQNLSAAKKERLWAALGEAALNKDETRQRQQLKQAVRQYSSGVVAAALAEEAARFERDGDAWSLKRYRQVNRQLADVAAEVKAETAPPKKDKSPVSQSNQSKNSGKGDDKKRSSKQTKSSARLKVSDAFGEQEIKRLGTITLLGSAATGRQLQALKLGASRGIGHSDPRAKDWMEQDRQNFRFLSRQLSVNKEGQGQLDTTALSEAELVDLWEFSRFEADRALRNIDHIQSGWSHLKGETADYMTRDHRLEGRFYTWLANNLEPRITPEMRDKYGAVEV